MRDHETIARLLARTLWMLPLVACEQAAGPAPSGSSAAGSATSIVIDRAGSRPTSKGPPERFIGDVTVVPLFTPNDARRTTAAYVTFEAGARSAWHSHPSGQTLVITEGTGWVQEEGGAKQTLRPGDVVWTPPGVRHWHGATTESAMTHMALQEDADNLGITWLQHVTEAEYRR